MLALKYLPNLITSFRLIGTFCLLFIEPLSGLFYLVYTLYGISDVLDGWIARKTKNTSEFGAKLDSVSDLLFYAVMLIRIFPELWKRLPVKIWIAVGGILLLRLVSYLYVAVRFHRFASLHTYWNKVTGASIFAIPYTLKHSIVVPFCWCVVAIAFIAAIYELGIHIGSNKHHAGYNRKSEAIAE